MLLTCFPVFRSWGHTGLKSLRVVFAVARGGLHQLFALMHHLSQVFELQSTFLQSLMAIVDSWFLDFFFFFFVCSNSLGVLTPQQISMVCWRLQFFQNHDKATCKRSCVTIYVCSKCDSQPMLRGMSGLRWWCFHDTTLGWLNLSWSSSFQIVSFP